MEHRAQSIEHRAWCREHGAWRKDNALEQFEFNANQLNCFDWNWIGEEGEKSEIQAQEFKNLAIEIADELGDFQKNVKIGIIC